MDQYSTSVSTMNCVCIGIYASFCVYGLTIVITNWSAN